jgi:hypothetical protein
MIFSVNLYKELLSCHSWTARKEEMLMIVYSFYISHMMCCGQLALWGNDINHETKDVFETLSELGIVRAFADASV